MVTAHSYGPSVYSVAQLLSRSSIKRLFRGRNRQGGGVPDAGSSHVLPAVTLGNMGYKKLQAKKKNANL